MTQNRSDGKQYGGKNENLVNNTMRTENDAELLRAYAETNNEGAFDEIVSRHGTMVYRVCFRTLVNRHDAEDASQAVFMALIKKSEKPCREGSLACWLYAVARQTALFMARTRVRRDQREMVASEVMGGSSDTQVSEQEREAVLGFLDKELDALSAGQREAVILRYLDGMSEKDAAAIAGCSYDAFRSRLGDGISNLRKRLVRRGCTFGVPALIGVLVADAQAAVPNTLIPSLLAVPKLYAAGAAAGTASANITYLMEGALKAMFITKIKMVGAMTAVVLLAGSGAVLAVKEIPGKTQVAAKEEFAVTNKPVLLAQNEVPSDKPEKKGTEVKIQQQTNPPAKTNASSQDVVDFENGDSSMLNGIAESRPVERKAETEDSQAVKDLKKKLENIVVKHLEFEETPLEGVIEACKVEALAGDPGKKGVNVFLIGISEEKLKEQVNIIMDEVPLLEVIRNVCVITNLQCELQDAGVVIMPADPNAHNYFNGTLFNEMNDDGASPETESEE